MLSLPRPKMPFTYVVNVYSDMSSSKGHLGSSGWGEASKNKLKDTSFTFRMTYVTILGVPRTHAQNDYGNVWELKSYTYEPRHEISNNVVCATSKSLD